MTATSFAAVRARLEALLEKCYVPMGGAFTVGKQVYYRDWSTSHDGVWTIEGMKNVIERIESGLEFFKAGDDRLTGTTRVVES